ncbi:MAG: GNAT family N-acetyltransferase [Armatimonadetes bacterium]|nr:GNAT family N-acetyltransferase [Armatimonadota bacterium]
MASEIQIVPLAETGVTAGQVADLYNTAFAEYEGVLRFTPETMAWYLERPGLGAGHVLLAMEGDRPVGGVMITDAPVVLGGEALPCAIIDSVMTHPDYRRRGIATRLMERALEWMRAAGLDASFLYTERGSAGYRIYTRLGYRERALVLYYFARPAPTARRTPRVRPALPHEEERVRALLNGWLGDADGYVPVDEALWRWRRAARPASLPYSILLLEEGDTATATGTLCAATVRLGGEPVDLVLLTDVAGATADDREAMVGALLQRVPRDYGAGLLTGSHDVALSALAERLGMHRFEEVALVAPLTERGTQALQRPPRGWYTLSESLIGI